MTGRRSAPSLPGYAAPTGLKFLWRWHFYKYAAPMALKEIKRASIRTESFSRRAKEKLR
jgi:hypothetical protein